jgi:hypothetical protein
MPPCTTPSHPATIPRMARPRRSRASPAPVLSPEQAQEADRLASTLSPIDLARALVVARDALRTIPMVGTPAKRPKTDDGRLIHEARLVLGAEGRPLSKTALAKRLGISVAALSNANAEGENHRPLPAEVRGKLRAWIAGVR